MSISISSVLTLVQNVLALVARHEKFVIAVVGAVVLILGRAFGQTSWEYADAVSVATALGVYAAPNKS